MKKNEFRFVIAGAGPTGIAVAHALVHEGRVKSDDILVVDEHAPLAQFTEHVNNIGMHDMRSPWTVSVDRKRGALVEFAERNGHPDLVCTRPTWRIFERHALTTWEKLKVTKRAARVTGITPDVHQDGWKVKADDDTITTDNVVIATGLAPHRVAPFEHTRALPDLPLLPTSGGQIAIIGSGMTATNAVLALLDHGAQVTLFAPNGLLTERSEMNAWLTGALGDGTCISEGAEDARRRFVTLDRRDRYQALKNNRIDGTMTSDHRALLAEAIENQRLALRQRRVESVRADVDGTFTVVANRQHLRGFETVYDARGFRPSLDNLANIEGLLEAVGDRRFEQYPLIDDRTGAVRPGLYIAGALAAMSFGPAANTVAGGTMLGHVMAQHT